MAEALNGDDQERRASRQETEAVAIAFRRGTPEAVRAVRRRVRKIVWFRGYGIPEDDKKDLEQEVMTQVWQAANRPGFDAGSRFWGFVEVVTARRCIDWRRSQVARSRETTLDENLPEPAGGPLRVTLDRERTGRAQAVLAQLAKPCRDLIYLHFAEGKSYAELSTVLGKSEGALRVQMHRCIARARQETASAPAGIVDESSGEER